MAGRIDKIHVRNFRSLADVEVDLRGLTVLFGRNGAGKSSFLDTVWFARDCAIRGVETAAGTRGHGIGLIYDGAPDDARVEVTLDSGPVRYALKFGLSSGRIDPFPGEVLSLPAPGRILIDREVGSDKARFWRQDFPNMAVTLREPQRLSLARYADLDATDEAREMDRVLRFIRLYDTRRFHLHRIKTQGSEASHETSLREYGENLWSVLRNLSGKSQVDERYETIMKYMKRAFPASFEGLVLEATGPTTVYGSFVEKDRRHPILASGVSDGHLQMLLLLTALFAEADNRGSLLLFDEPEISLHPWAIAVLAEAIREAESTWAKQIILATHSPVLLSQFEPDEILVSEMVDGCTQLQRLSEKKELADFVAEYSVGALYMSEMLAPQSDGVSASEGASSDAE